MLLVLRAVSGFIETSAWQKAHSLCYLTSIEMELLPKKSLEDHCTALFAGWDPRFKSAILDGSSGSGDELLGR